MQVLTIYLTSLTAVTIFAIYTKKTLIFAENQK